MAWTAQQKIRIGFLLLALVPIVLGALAARNAYELAQVSQQLATTNDINVRLEKLFSEIKDIEVAQREYILMGGDEPIQIIQKSREAILTDLQTLRDLRKLGPRDIWLTNLETLIAEKFDIIDETIQLRQQAGAEAASQGLLATRGRQAVEDIRIAVRRLFDEERAQLNAHNVEQKSRFIGTLQLFVVVLLVNVALIAILYILQLRETERAREVNEELERRVALRTEALQRSNEDLQQFAYIASHDLKEPLRMVSSYTTMLQRRYSGRLDADADTFIAFIIDGVRRMNTLIQDILEYSRARAGKEDQLSDVEVNSILRNVVANLKVTIAEAGAWVQWESLPQSVPYDAVRLTQVFQNLISNAIKYRGDRRPEVHIRAEQNNDEIVFSVNDNGMGIDAEHVDKIFGIFQRLHGKEYEGSGIGLAMVKKIVERFGGRIWVESTPGQGSTFFFTVLRTATAPATEAFTTTTS